MVVTWKSCESYKAAGDNPCLNYFKTPVNEYDMDPIDICFDIMAFYAADVESVLRIH